MVGVFLTTSLFSAVSFLGRPLLAVLGFAFAVERVFVLLGVVTFGVSATCFFGRPLLAGVDFGVAFFAEEDLVLLVVLEAVLLEVGFGVVFFDFAMRQMY